MSKYDEKVKEVYPLVNEELIDFLNGCKLKDSEVMKCPRCSNVLEKRLLLRKLNPNLIRGEMAPVKAKLCSQ